MIMEILRYFDSEQSRSGEFVRYQLSKSENYFVLEVLQCKSFSSDIAVGELYIEEFIDVSDAETAYQNKISIAVSLSPSVLIRKEIQNSK